MIAAIPPGRVEEAVEVLALAFEDYPLMRYFLPDSGQAYGAHLRALLRFSCEIRLAVDDPLLGIEHAGRLAAVACVSGPESSQQPWPASVYQAQARLKALTGRRSAARSTRFARMSGDHRPSAPHFHVGVIGVDPRQQGAGLGKALLNAIQALSESHAGSTGVDLETVNPANVTRYEHCGYHVTASAKFGPLQVWYMFRPNRTGAETTGL